MIADELFLGHDLLAWLVLAFGGALAVGNIAALVRPPGGEQTEPPTRAMRRRGLLFIVVGTIAAVWALATLSSG